MKQYSIYLHDGNEVVLLYRHNVEELNSTIKPIADEDTDINPYLLTDEIRGWIEEDRISVCGTHDHCYVCDWECPEEITYEFVINRENEYSRIYAWVTAPFAKQDLAEQQLCITTKYGYDWTSDRARYIRNIRVAEGNRKELGSLKKDWEEKIAEYDEEALEHLDNYSFDSLCEEAGVVYSALSLREIADNDSLTYVETTSEPNGYPSHIRSAVLAPVAWGDAQALAEKYGLTLMLLHKRDGWQLWHRKGLADEPIRITEEDYGDDFSFLRYMDDEDFYAQEVEPLLDSFSTLSELRAFVEKMESIYDKILTLGEDERAVLHDGEYMETISTEVTYWNYDTHQYAIALVDLYD